MCLVFGGLQIDIREIFQFYFCAISKNGLDLTHSKKKKESQMPNQ